MSVLASALRARCRFCWRFASVLTAWFVVGAGASSLRRIRRHHSPLRRQFSFFFYRLRAKRKKYHGLTTIGFSATSGMDRWPCSAGSSHQKWCLRRTECVVSSCGLAKLSVSVLLVSHVFLPARVSAVYIAGVW